MTYYLDTNNFETYVNACAERAGVRVVWDEPDSVPRTNGSTLYLPRLTTGTSEEQLMKLRFFIKHETSHIVYTNFEFFAKKGLKGLLQFICNLLEDNRIDYLNDSQFAGDTRLANEYAEVFAASLKGIISKIGPEKKMLAPLFMWDADFRGWTPNYSIIADEFQRGLGTDAEVMGRYNKLSAGKYGERLLSLRTDKEGGTVKLHQLARDILKDIYGEEPDKYEKKPEEEGKSKGKGDKESEQPGDAEGDAGGEEEGDAKGKTPLDDDVDRILDVEKYEKAIGFDHLKPSRTGTHLKQAKPGRYTEWRIPNAKDFIVRREFKDDTRGRGYFKPSSVLSVIENDSKPLSAKLRHKLQVRARGRWDYGTKSGKLHNGSLHRLISGKGTEAESRVFRRHITSDTLDTAVELLVDCSGSMSGTKFETACAGAASLAMALKPLHIPYSVVGFTNEVLSSDRNIIWVFNEYGENVTAPEMVRRFAVASSELMDNADGDAISWASNHLMQRKEKRKLLIVLSDGSPAGRSSAGDVQAWTKNVISNIETKKLHEIYGIGILDTNVCHYYTNHVVVRTMDDLAPKILSIIDKIL